MIRAVTAVPPALLIVVAATQMVLARTAQLTPWKGGGFGMFATLDHAPFRGVDIVVKAVDRSEALEIPSSLDALAARVVACPSEAFLERFARAIAARERRHGRAVATVTLRVWRWTFDPITLHATERELRTSTFAIP